MFPKEYLVNLRIIIRNIMILAIMSSYCINSYSQNNPGLLADDLESQQNHVSDSRDDLFQTKVQPILEQNCVACHGESVQMSNLRLDSVSYILRGGDFGPTVVPGDGKNSLLLEAVQYENDLKMPPTGKLEAHEIETLEKWIKDQTYWESVKEKDSAAIYGEIPWSFQPIKAPDLPQVNNDDWAQNPIDLFVLDNLSKNGLAPSDQADKRTLLRRLKLTLHGIPPTLEEQEEFLNDDSSDAYSKLVDRLLDSPRYGERWGQHWLDVIGFGETHGFEVNTPRENAWQYRDYVINAFNEDKPYDEFIIEQIAGDAVYEDVATGFLVSSPALLAGSGIGQNIESILQARQDELNGVINVVSSSLLGVTVSCARCHNHKFDPVSQEDYYAIQAVFSGVKHGERINKPKDFEQRMAVVQQLSKVINELETNIAEASHFANAQTFILDDQGPSAESLHKGYVTYFTKPDDVIKIKDGEKRGETYDAGDIQRLPNFSTTGTIWDNDAHTNLLTYSPQLDGNYQIWISWLSGIDGLSNEAHYILDHDGNLETEDDQKLLAKVDQSLFANLSNPEDNEAVWSGFYPVGKHDLFSQSVIVLRSGDDYAKVSADKIAFQVSDAIEAHPRLRPSVNPEFNVERVKSFPAKYVRLSVFKTNDGMEPCIDEIEIYGEKSPDINLALATHGARATASESWDTAIHQVEHINDGKTGNSFSWIPTQQKSWVQIELAKAHSINKIIWGRDQTGEYQDRLAVSYEIEVSLDEKNWMTVASSADRLPFRKHKPHKVIQSAVGRNVEEKAYHAWLTKKNAAQKTIQELTDFNSVYAGIFEEPEPVHRLYRGDPMQKREAVAPNTIQVLGDLNQVNHESSDQERRLAFANWIASESNPLTARVLVNRLWYYHFGEGIVNTPSDFGANGGVPSHPELLDWLAMQFIESDFSIKEMHRLILNSQTFQQDSTPNTEAMKIDSQNRLLWRFAPRRLEAEAIRDSILLVSGKLNLEMGGPGFSVFKDNDNYVRVYEPKEEWGLDEFRRMVYATKIRMEKDATFGAFDCPDLGQTAPKRPRSTTPLQALNLLNSGFVNQQAEFLMERLTQNAENSIEKQVHLCYELAYGRSPDPDELEKTTEFIDEHGLLAFCRAVLNSSELLFIH